LQEYYSDIGHFPTKAEGGLNALVKPPKNQIVRKKWDGPYLEGQDEIPEDGWGFQFEYYAPPRQKGKFRHFELLSHGEEGPDGNSDEIVVGA
ncbi:MAG: type II secretion system protein GspG, partial [Candidatus Dependentiae bacterium]